MRACTEGVDEAASMSKAKTTCIAVLALVGAGVVTPGWAYKPPRPLIIPLTAALIEKTIACWPAVEKARKQVATEVTGTTRSDATTRRRRKNEESGKALETCGFPAGQSWSATIGSIAQALGRRQHGRPGTLDESDNEVQGAQAARIHASNRRLVAKNRARLERLFRE